MLLGMGDGDDFVKKERFGNSVQPKPGFGGSIVG